LENFSHRPAAGASQVTTACHCMALHKCYWPSYYLRHGAGAGYAIMSLYLSFRLCSGLLQK